MEEKPKKSKRRLIILVLLFGIMLVCFCSGIAAVLGWQHYANTIIVTPTPTVLPQVSCYNDTDCRSQGVGLACVLGKCLPIEPDTVTPTPTTTGTAAPTITAKPTTACNGTGGISASSSNNGTTVNTNCGQKLNVAVTYCNTCGYTVDTPLTFDSAILKFDGTTVAPTSTPTGSPVVGGSTTVIYTFTTIKAGNSHLKITSSQSWNPSSRVTNVDFTVKVN